MNKSILYSYTAPDGMTIYARDNVETLETLNENQQKTIIQNRVGNLKNLVIYNSETEFKTSQGF